MNSSSSPVIRSYDPKLELGTLHLSLKERRITTRLLVRQRQKIREDDARHVP